MVLIVICIDPFGDPAVVHVLVVRSPLLPLYLVVWSPIWVFLSSYSPLLSVVLGCCIICGALSLLGIYIGALSVSILSVLLKKTD